MFENRNKEYCRMKGEINMFYGNYNCNNNQCCDIYQTLNKIERLQREAVSNELQEGCCRDVLGENDVCDTFNTRPITFYTAENRQIEFPTRRSDSGCGCDSGQKSCVFRVECVNNNTCQCRVLVEGKNRCGRNGYTATDSFVTIRLADIASCRCLPDTFVDLCIR
jgi:hypothetical protein